MGNAYRPGDYYVICDRSGRKIKRSEARREWNGLLVHKDYWEPRHPQDFVRSRADDQSVPDPRSEPDGQFLVAGDVTAADLTANPSGDSDQTLWDTGTLAYPTQWDVGTTVWTE